MAEIRIPRTSPTGRNTRTGTFSESPIVPFARARVAGQAFGAVLGTVGDISGAIQEDRQKRNQADASQAMSLYRQFEVEEDDRFLQALENTEDPEEAGLLSWNSAQRLEDRANELANMIQDPEVRGRFASVVQERLGMSLAEKNRDSRVRRDAIVEESNTISRNQTLQDGLIGTPEDRARMIHEQGVQRPGDTTQDTLNSAYQVEVNFLLSQGLVDDAIDLMSRDDVAENFFSTGNGESYRQATDMIRGRAKAQDRAAYNAAISIAKQLSSPSDWEDMSPGELAETIVTEIALLDAQLSAMDDKENRSAQSRRNDWVYSGNGFEAPDATLVFETMLQQRNSFLNQMTQVESLVRGRGEYNILQLTEKKWDLWWGPGGNKTRMQLLPPDQLVSEVNELWGNLGSVHNFVRDDIKSILTSIVRTGDSEDVSSSERAGLVAQWMNSRLGSLGIEPGSDDARWISGLAKEFEANRDNPQKAYTDAEEGFSQLADEQMQKNLTRARNTLSRHYSREQLRNAIAGALGDAKGKDAVLQIPGFTDGVQSKAVEFLANTDDLTEKSITNAVNNATLQEALERNIGPYRGVLMENDPNTFFRVPFAEREMSIDLAENGLQGEEDNIRLFVPTVDVDGDDVIQPLIEREFPTGIPGAPSLKILVPMLMENGDVFNFKTSRNFEETKAAEQDRIGNVLAADEDPQNRLKTIELWETALPELATYLFPSDRAAADAWAEKLEAGDTDISGMTPEQRDFAMEVEHIFDDIQTLRRSAESAAQHNTPTEELELTNKGRYAVNPGEVIFLEADEYTELMSSVQERHQKLLSSRFALDAVQNSSTKVATKQRLQRLRDKRRTGRTRVGRLIDHAMETIFEDLRSPVRQFRELLPDVRQIRRSAREDVEALRREQEASR